MAKQSGIHQLRGKVGEHSYYRQTGIVPGLVRSINQALSGRVKTGEEYANTRLNNQEFGQAGRIAATAIRSITPKYRPMILPFSQAKAVKDILREIQLATGTWGQRNLTDANGDIIAPILNKLSKNNMSDFGITFSNPSEGDLSISGAEPDFENHMEAIGADGAVLDLYACNLWVGDWISGQGYFPTVLATNSANTDESPSDFEWQPTISMPADPPSPRHAHSVKFYMLVVLPYRRVNGLDYILQEHCAFRAYSLGGQY